MKEIIRIVSNLAFRIAIPYYLFYGVLTVTSNISISLIFAIYFALMTNTEDLR